MFKHSVVPYTEAWTSGEGFFSSKRANCGKQNLLVEASAYRGSPLKKKLQGEEVLVVMGVAVYAHKLLEHASA